MYKLNVHYKVSFIRANRYGSTSLLKTIDKREFLYIELIGKYETNVIWNVFFNNGITRLNNEKVDYVLYSFKLITYNFILKVDMPLFIKMVLF